LATAVTGLVNLLLEGRCPAEFSQVLFGGRLFALQNKSCMWREANRHRVRVAPFGGQVCKQFCAGNPRQQASAVPGKRRVRSCRSRHQKVYGQHMGDDDILVKLYFSNALKNVRRDVMLKSVAAELLKLY